MMPRIVTGIVLAGGRSSRMGTDKAMLLYKGKPLIQHATDKLKQVCTKVVISANSDKYRLTGCECWPDELPSGAPMIGIYSCLKRSETKWNVVLSCDMPLVNPDFLIELLAACENADLIVPVHDDGCIEPLCAIYSRDLLLSLKDSIDRSQYGLIHFALESDHRVVKINTSNHVYEPGMFININTAADFDLLNNS